MWIVDVVAGDVRVPDAETVWNMCLSVDYLYAFCIGTVNRFTDPKARWVELSLHLELFVLILLSENVADRRDVEVLRELASESAHVEPEVSLVAELEGTGEMSHFLILVDVFDLSERGLFVADVVDIEIGIIFHDLP